MLKAFFSHNDFVVRQDPIDKVIADETVKRVLAILEVTVIFTGISGINGIINLLGMCNQIVDSINAVSFVDRVWLNESRKLEVTLLNPLNRICAFCLTFQREVVGVGRVL